MDQYDENVQESSEFARIPLVIFQLNDVGLQICHIFWICYLLDLLVFSPSPLAIYVCLVQIPQVQFQN